MPTIPNMRQIFPKFFVSRPDGVTYQDLTDYLVSAEMERGDVSAVGTGSTGADGLAQVATFSLHNDGSQIITWLSTLSRDGLSVVGDSTTVVGDSLDGAENLVNLLFDTTHYFTRDSFSPIDKRSFWNYYNDAFAPLIFPMRKVYYRVAIQSTPAQESGTTMHINRTLGLGNGVTTSFQIPVFPLLPGSVVVKKNSTVTTDYTVNNDTGLVTFGTAPALGTVLTYSCTYYKTRFSGWLGDDINVKTSTVDMLCRDEAKLLQRAYITNPKIYGDNTTGTAAETVIRDILDDNGLNFVTFNMPVSPGFQVIEYELKYKSVWDAIQEIVAQFGWFFGTRYDATVNDLVLTLMAPPRDKTTPDYILTAEDDIYVGTLGLSDSTVRNWIKIGYFDRELGQDVTLDPDDPAFAPYLKDQTSIDTYGFAPMEVIEKDVPLIDTQQEALDFGYAILQDLKDLSGTYSLNLPVYPDMEMFDGIGVDNPLVSSTVDFYAVESVRETYNFGDDMQFRTEVTASGRVIGGRQKWLRMQTRPGSGEPIAGNELVDSQTVVYVAAVDTPLAKRKLAKFSCDGTDDHLQINAAISSLPTGGKVVLLEGTFVPTGQINLANNIAIEGQDTSTVFKYPDGFVPSTSVLELFKSENKENVAIRYLKINGNRGGIVSGGQTAISITGGKNIVISNLIVTSFSANGLFLSQGSTGEILTNVKVTNCTFDSNYGGVIISPNVTVSDVIIDGCTIVNNENIACQLGYNCTLASSYIAHTTGIFAVDVYDNSTVTNNYIVNNQKIGLRTNGDNINVSNNKLFSNGLETDGTYAQMSITNSNDCNVQGNVCRLPQSGNRANIGIVVDLSSGTLLTNNDCYNSGLNYGIFDAGVNTNFGAGNRNNDGTWSTTPN